VRHLSDAGIDLAARTGNLDLPQGRAVEIPTSLIPQEERNKHD
jgi:hypothetical protein